MNILIIEDEKLLADSIGALLRGKGFEVEMVYDGETGSQYAGRLRGPGRQAAGDGRAGGGRQPTALVARSAVVDLVEAVNAVVLN